MGTSGQIIGGLVGGAIGYWAQYPFIGFTLGWGLGTLFDPPDYGQPPGRAYGEPEIQELSITTAEEGEVVPDILGVTKLAGNILWNGNNRSVAQTDSVTYADGYGKGGGPSYTTETYITGYTYYLTWVHGICAGPVDTLYTILADENVIWSGELSRDDPAVESGQISITLNNNMGTVIFFFGSGDHEPHASVHTDRDYNIPYRNLCYALFLDVRIGSANRVPTLKFVLGKRPVLAFSNKETLNDFNYNPAHAFWYLATGAAGIPATMLSATSFASAASLFESESLGVSITVGNTGSVLDYMQSLLQHIHAMACKRSDGLIHLVPIRNDYDPETLPLIDESVLTGPPTMERSGFSESVGEVRVEFSKQMKEEITE